MCTGCCAGFARCRSHRKHRTDTMQLSRRLYLEHRHHKGKVGDQEHGAAPLLRVLPADVQQQVHHCGGGARRHGP